MHERESMEREYRECWERSVNVGNVKKCEEREHEKDRKKQLEIKHEKKHKNRKKKKNVHVSN